MVELLVSMGVLAVIFAISTIALSGVIPNTSQNTTYDVLISDIKAQQTRAMSTNSSFGVYFGTDSYTLFKGNSFTGGTDKFVVTLDPTITLTNVTFPDSQLVFSPGSGDVTGYTQGSDSLDITNTQIGKVTPLKINKHGATY